jgi:cytochrome oxidase Cu insertion factor (SCO1/SenC/PrrC family)
MNNKSTLTFVITILFAFTGCLDNLNGSDSNDFWGDDCLDDSSDCPGNPALNFILVDQNNNTVNLSQFEGKIVVITFVYTTCPDICPAVTYQMKKLGEELGDAYEESVVFLSVTVDPKRDTPEQLANFASNYDAYWQFLTVNSTFPENHMEAMWSDYKVQVLVEPDACSGYGHYMEGYDGCQCNPGYIQDSNDTVFGMDVCISDPDYEFTHLVFENGSVESQIISALDIWTASNGLISDENAMLGIDTIISQTFGSKWNLNDIDGNEHKSKDYYKQNLTLIEFFHTDCPHCQNQIPVLKEFYSNYSSEVNLLSIGGYSLGSNKDNLTTLQNFSLEHNTTWPYLYDDQYSLIQAFGHNSYPSWTLLAGDMEGGNAQIVATTSGSQTYEQLVERVTNYPDPMTLSVPMTNILYNFTHWQNGHISNKTMMEYISTFLNYDSLVEVDDAEVYGVSHSARLYIIDQEGNFRVLWRGYEWTYASLYHDITLLL